MGFSVCKVAAGEQPLFFISALLFLLPQKEVKRDCQSGCILFLAVFFGDTQKKNIPRHRILQIISGTSANSHQPDQLGNLLASCDAAPIKNHSFKLVLFQFQRQRIFIIFTNG